MDDFKIRAKQKFIENLVSVKVWIVFGILFFSSFFLWNGLLTGAVWASINGGVISTVCALREVFKVAKIKSDDDSSNLMT
jgi:hypothetical protein